MKLPFRATKRGCESIVRIEHKALARLALAKTVVTLSKFLGTFSWLENGIFQLCGKRASNTRGQSIRQPLWVIRKSEKRANCIDQTCMSNHTCKSGFIALSACTSESAACASRSHVVHSGSTFSHVQEGLLFK